MGALKGDSFASMAEITGTVMDGDVKSSVPRWQLSRGKTDHWKAPVHEVSDDSWRAEFAFHEVLGHGGFATVTRATHIQSGTEVAVKLVMDRTEDGKPSAKSESVRREIDTMRRMDHPSIVSLIEVFVHKPVPQASDPNAPWVRRWFLVLELCHGQDLQHLILEEGALDLDLMREVFAQLAAAIQYTHWRGVIHRDIKPGNVMLLDESTTGGRVRIKLLDFGLAESLDANFVKFYRKSARKRAQTANTPLPRQLIDQDSMHPRSQSGRKGNGAGVSFSRAIVTGLGGGGGSGPAPADDDSSEDGSLRGDASRGTTPYANAGTPLPSIGERRGTGASEGGVVMAVVNAAKPFRPEPSRMSKDMVPTGTREFAAPEVFEPRRFKPKAGAVGGDVDDVVVPTPLVADSFSLGVLLGYALTGAPPGTDARVYAAIRRLNPMWLALNALRGCSGKPPRRLRTLEELPDDARLLVLGLTDPDYHTRLTMGDIVAHPWVRSSAQIA